MNREGGVEFNYEVSENRVRESSEAPSFDCSDGVSAKGLQFPV